MGVVEKSSGHWPQLLITPMVSVTISIVLCYSESGSDLREGTPGSVERPYIVVFVSNFSVFRNWAVNERRIVSG